MKEQRTAQSNEAHMITVVIPVYNAESYLENCLDSVLASSFSDLEIICVDDGSCDRSMEILHTYSQMDPRIRIITQDHQFAGAARNAGIKAASGKYIHFLDSDDEIVPYAYERLIAAAEADQAEVCECLYIERNTLTGTDSLHSHYRRQNKRLPLAFSTGGVNTRSLVFGHVMPWNKLYLRDFLIRNNILFDGLICAEDRSFYFEVLYKAAKILRIPDRLIIHRINMPTSLDGSDVRLRNFDVEFRSFERIWNILRDVPMSLKRIVLENCIHDSMIYYIRAIGTVYEQPIRNMLTGCWQPYMPLLGRDIRLRWWYVPYIGLIAENMPGWYGKPFRFLAGQYLDAYSRSGL